VKVTKRYSHGLQAAGNFTWAKASVIGSASDSTFFLGGQAVTTDVYNFNDNKQVNQYVRPLALTATFSYTTPGFSATSTGMKVLSHVVRDWQTSAVLRYQSGAFIESALSFNNLTNQLGRVGGYGGGAVNFQNPTGQPMLLVDPNCGCFNPQTTQVLNPKAFSDAPVGTWGTAAPYYSNYRWQRQPAESMAFARNFRIKEGYVLQVRAEFQNIFNRTFLSSPSVNSIFGAVNPLNPIGTTNYAGNVINSSGYGTIATLGGAGAQPRSGQIIVRFTF